MKRTPLKRKTPMPRARKPIAARSAKRKAEAPERARVREQVLDRDGHRCTMFGLAPGPCGSPFPWRPPLEVHEVIPRGRWRAGYLVVSNCVTGCQLHHDWVTSHPVEATALGLMASAPPKG